MRAGNCRLISEIVKYPDSFKSIDWPEVVNDPNELVRRAYETKEFQAIDRITFPIQDEPFLRSLGVKLEYDWRLGIRVEESRLNKEEVLNHLLSLEIDWEPIEILKQAIVELKKNNQEILLEVSGIMTIINAFLPFEEIVILTRREPEIYQRICQKISDILREYLFEVITWGIDYIYFADAVAGIDIVGPKFFIKYIGPYLVDVFEPVSKISRTHILLCPRTFRSMVLLDRIKEDESGIFHPTACSAFAIEMPVGPGYRFQ